MSETTSTVRDRILQAARRLFLTKGFNGSNLRDIAKEAQVSMGGIYHHFASKEEIYEALLPATQLAQRMPHIAALFRARDFPENLSAIGRAIFELVRSYKDDFKFVYIDILEFQGRNIKPLIDALYHAFVQNSDALLERREGQRSLRDIHPAVFTRSVIALFLHFYLESVMLEQSLSDELGMSEDAIADQIANLLLNGIFASPTSD
ncbi:MAG: TetR/AcrR family transcriptional regulator [Myxococcota bacterium]|jgi:AcrR family transcriptional regulator